MRWEEIEVRWTMYRRLAARRWLALSDSQLELIGGRRQMLTQILQDSYGVTREIAELEIDTWCTTFDDEEHESLPHGASIAAAPFASRLANAYPDQRRRTHPRR